MNRLLIFIFAFINLNWQNVTYKILDWQSANDLKERNKEKKRINIDYTFSNVYQLEDSSYLITPLNPFGNSIQTKDKSLLDSWVKDRSFPIVDDFNSFYIQNKNKIDELLFYKDELKRDIWKFAFNNENSNIDNPSPEDIDNIYKILKKKRKLKEFKLNFIVLIGDFVLKKNANLNWKWGILKNNQFLNPVVDLIIIKDEKQNLYYNIQADITGKWGYLGVHYISKSILQFSSKVNEIENMVKII